MLHEFPEWSQATKTNLQANAYLYVHVRAGRRLHGLLIVTLLLAAGCGDVHFLDDPTERATIAALGPEDPAVGVGPLHRPGQPCAACHHQDGLASPHTAAGTVYRDPMGKLPVADVVVTLVDAAGKTFTTRTNCVGSFYVRPSEFTPTLPFWVSIQLGEFPWKMSSPVHREASCAACHFDPPGPSSAGHVFLTDDETAFSTIPLRACTAMDSVSR